MLNIFEYALVTLFRRWQKHIAMVLIYALLVAFYASVVLLTANLRQEAKVVLQDIPELWIQQIAGGRLQPIQASLVDSLQNIRGVEKVYPRIWGYLPESTTGAVLTIMGINGNLSEIPYIQLQNSWKSTALNENEVLVGTGLLELRNLQIGDYFSVADVGTVGDSIQSFKIVGAFEAKADLLTKDLLVFSSQTARKLLNMQPNEATDIALKIRNSAEVDNIGKKIDFRFSALRVVSKKQLAATYETLFGWRGGMLIFGSLMALLAFVMLVWDKASGLSHQEQKELGILKSVGWSIGNVLWLKMAEGLIISFTATILGLCLAFLHLFAFDAALLKPFMAGWSVLYPSFRLPFFIDLSSLLLVMMLAIVPYLTATLIPAWFAAITDPAEVMK
jgi:ABC-type lipoprotein release transport system permease subunit